MLRHLLDGESAPGHWHGARPKLVEVHRCHDLADGAADFIGIVYDKPTPEAGP